MTPIITAFERSPDRGQGLARDMRVRWALAEVGQPYDVRLVSFAEMKAPAHRKLHPFGNRLFFEPPRPPKGDHPREPLIPPPPRSVNRKSTKSGA